MKRIAATLIGTALASGLALAAQPDSPEKLAARYFAATNEAGLAASWRDWHPDATQSITVKYGGTQPDYHITYAMRDWDQLPDWKSDPAMAEALRGYTELARSAPEITPKVADTHTLITAVTQVDYQWGGYKGRMVVTDQFTVTALMGAYKIRKLETLYDYR